MEMLFLGVIGIVFLSVAIVLSHIRRRKIKLCLEKTMAKLTEYSIQRTRSASGHYSTFYHPVYAYYVKGVKYYEMSSYGLRRMKQDVGRDVLLYYNSENPNMFFVEEDLRISKILSIIFGLLGLVFLIISGASLVFL